MRQTVLIVAVLTLLDVGCSFDSTPSAKNGVKTNGEAAEPYDWISKLESEFNSISEDKARVTQLLESGRSRAKAKKLRFEDAARQ